MPVLLCTVYILFVFTLTILYLWLAIWGSWYKLFLLVFASMIIQHLYSHNKKSFEHLFCALHFFFLLLVYFVLYAFSFTKTLFQSQKVVLVTHTLLVNAVCFFMCTSLFFSFFFFFFYANRRLVDLDSNIMIIVMMVIIVMVNMKIISTVMMMIVIIITLKDTILHF